MLTKPIQILSIILPLLAFAILWFVGGLFIPWYCYVTLLFGVPLFVVLVNKLLSHIINKSTEYLGAYVTSITYYEPWNEQVLRFRQVEDGKDSNGNIKYRTETYYETVYHPESYGYETNTLKRGEISEDTFNHWKFLLDVANPTFIDMFRNYYTINGNAWRYEWNGRNDTIIPLTFKHRYFNPLKYSNSIYKNKKIDEKTVKEYGLVDHPEMWGAWYQHCVVGNVDKPVWDMCVQRLNAKLGCDNQFRLYVVVFDGNNSTMDTFHMQKAYWNNGNKNEFVLCVGLDPKTNKLIWHNSFSWCKEPKLEARVRNYLSTKDYFDCNEFCCWLESVVPTDWDRRSFKEFKYLDTYFPTWANILIFTLSLAATIGIGIWCL